MSLEEMHDMTRRGELFKRQLILLMRTFENLSGLTTDGTSANGWCVTRVNCICHERT